MLNTEEREQKTSTSVCDIIILDKYFKSKWWSIWFCTDTLSKVKYSNAC